MNQQITNYIRGKVLEMVIVGVATYPGVRRAGHALLAVAGGAGGLLGVDPHIGAVLVTIPVVVVALFQWGVGADFGR
ncbi:AI-2E family transporter [Serratia marcescens]|uniref:AI-2E family transporter n=1 Tax=Serratia marcescens TaxID=615 RepID=A0A939NQC4_SERMA|nr:AI-2E family transporter [Serratia marcescens]